MSENDEHPPDDPGVRTARNTRDAITMTREVAGVTEEEARDAVTRCARSGAYLVREFVLSRTAEGSGYRIMPVDCSPADGATAHGGTGTTEARLNGIEARLNTIGQRIGSSSTEGILGLLGRQGALLAVIARQAEEIRRAAGLETGADGEPVTPFPPAGEAAAAAITEDELAYALIHEHPGGPLLPADEAALLFRVALAARSGSQDRQLATAAPGPDLTRPEECLGIPLRAEQATAVLIRLGCDPEMAAYAVRAAGTAGQGRKYDIGDYRVIDEQGTISGYPVFRVERRRQAAPEQVIAHRVRVPLPEALWPELGDGWDVSEILAAVEVVDRHPDEAAPEVYRGDHPASRLANRWRRIAGGPGCEVHEATEALNLSTGGNPRKGIAATPEDVLAELGDTVVAALLGIQSETKDADATWAVFTAALAKALSRVPPERPAPQQPGPEAES